MIDLVTTSFYLKASDFTKKDFERYSTSLFDDWDRFVAKNIDLTDYSLTLVVEEGSIKGKGKIAASMAVLYVAIGQYGDFISGLKTIEGQVNYVTNALYDQAKNTFGCGNAPGNTKKNSGAIPYLKHLFNRVQSGEITADEATELVRARYGDDATSVPGFMGDLKSSLTQAPKYPEQLTLVDGTWTDCEEPLALDSNRHPKLPRPNPIPISHHYRIEISRESKQAKRKVKITKVK